MTAPHDEQPVHSPGFSEAPEAADAVELVRPYVITNGRGSADTAEFDVVTLVTASASGQRTGHLDPEKRSLLELCEGGYLSVAEIAGHLRLPIGIVRVLLSDLARAGYITTRAPVPAAQLTDIQVLQEVLDGLQARFG
ncbi:DUF742 domain-containing protein [Streptomyces sp. DSM 44917]|uniref:DUF742 domain-containing protein n=1 Tax=Streptomyces boetiae TaxID=3075541 RepID=A0ABU2L4Q0_9ACTN|nr:DUF742 domain-containing protein [Streptomyces sp. DSM 44917]MDT0306535.1 DUF742 domain-containing protein [Streptomyces sp. DSM 44917]